MVNFSSLINSAYSQIILKHKADFITVPQQSKAIGYVYAAYCVVLALNKFTIKTDKDYYLINKQHAPF